MGPRTDTIDERVTGQKRERVLALLTFDCVDEWLDGLHLDLNGFASEMGCGWFNCLQSLKTAGVKCVLYGTSSKVALTTRFLHEPTGSTICLLPSSRLYTWLKAHRQESAPDASAYNLVPKPQRISKKVLSIAIAYLSLPLIRFAREIKRDGCRCIFLEQYMTPRFDLTVLLGLLVGVPVYGHFAANHVGANRWVTSLVYPLRRPALRLCAGFVICASTEIEWMTGTYALSSRKFSNIPFPVDTSFWRPLDKQDARASLGIARDARLVLWHGGIDIWVKGLDILISAWEVLKRDDTAPPWRLVIIGDGSETGSRTLHRMLAARHLQGVTFIDRWITDRTLLRTYLTAADVYVFPSRSDAFGIAAAEAMACGCPLVASSGAGVAELLAAGEEAGGLVVPPEDVVALAVALRRFLNDAEFAEALGRRARRTVEEAASMEAVGKQMANFLFPPL